MEKVDAVGTPYAHLSLTELKAKLEQVRSLMNISSWSSQANDGYYELFGVDKDKEAMNRGKLPVRSTWKPTHRLHSFVWDEACEYPLPQTDPQLSVEDENNGSKNDSGNIHGYDECLLPLLKNMLEEELKGPWAL